MKDIFIDFIFDLLYDECDKQKEEFKKLVLEKKKEHNKLECSDQDSTMESNGYNDALNDILDKLNKKLYKSSLK